MSILERMLGLRGRDFRNTRWGISSRRVRKLESAIPFFESDDLLVYKTMLLNKPVEVVYIFTRDQLVRTKYVFSRDHVDPNDHCKDYESMVKLLAVKYGTPVYAEQIWHDTLFKNNKNLIGEALINGHVSYYSQWCLGTTFITHMLANSSAGIKHEIEYCGTAYKRIEQMCDQLLF